MMRVYLLRDQPITLSFIFRSIPLPAEATAGKTFLLQDSHLSASGKGIIEDNVFPWKVHKLSWPKKAKGIYKG